MTITAPTVDPTPAEASSVGITDDRWPYGPNINPQARRALVDWATAHRLRYSPRGRCLHWITTGRCAVQACDRNRARRQWMDHVTGWTRAGRPAVLVAQPYAITGASIDALAEIDRTDGLDVVISGTGWYGHGTTFVGIWAQPTFPPR